MITDTIGIGDSSDSRQPPSACDAILNVAVDLDIPMTQGNVHRHKVGLVDGPGNDDFILLSAVLVLHALSRKYRRILVHCHEGKSRSVMVVSAYVSVITGMEFDKVLKDVMNARGVTDYRPALYQQFVQLIPTIRRLIRT
jgi:protein-tyrosine phosphatase